MPWGGLIRELWQGQWRWLLAVGLLLVINLSFYVVLQQFLVPRVVEREQRFIQRQDQARQLLREAEGIADTPERHYLRVRQDIEQFRTIIPEYEDFTGLIDELLVHAARSHLTIRQISYTTEALPSVALRQYDLAFTVNGRYENLKQFIHALEQSPRIMAIRQIALDTRDQASGQGVSLRLSLQTLFQLEADRT